MNMLEGILNAPGWEALGRSVMHFLWQGSIIGLIAGIVLLSLRNRSAELRYLVAGLSLVAMVAVFVGTFIALLPEKEIVEKAPSAPVRFETGPAMAAPAVEPAVDAPSVSEEFDYFKVPAACWILGVFGMLVRFGTAQVRTGQLRRKGISPPEDRWMQAFETLKEQLGVNQAVGLVRSSIAETAMVVGWLKPIVIVPASAFTALTPEQLRAVLAHELAHIRRYDHWVNFLQGLVEILIFFHPAAWWLSRQMRIDREHCCDDQAVRVTGSPKTLAEALLRLESFRAAFVSASLAANGGNFKDRILRILGSGPSPKNNQPNRNMMMKKTAGAIGAAAILLGGVSLMNGDEKENTRKNGVKEERIQRVQDEILKALENGEISREEAAQKLNRLRKAGGAKFEKKDKEWSKTKEDFEGIEKRLRAAVESGELSGEEARKKLMAIKKKMAGVEAGEKASEKAMTEEKMRGMARRIRGAVERGEISKEEAEKKMMELRKMMRGNEAGGKEIDPGMKKDIARFRREIEERSDKENLRELRGLISDLEISKKAGEKDRVKILAIEIGLIKEALEKGGKDKGRNDDKSDEVLERLAGWAQETGGKIKAAAEKGELSEDEAWEKWMSFKKRELGPKIEKMVDAGQISGKAAKAFWREMEVAETGERIKGAVERGELSEDEAREKWEKLQKGREDKDEEEEEVGGVYQQIKKMGIDEETVGRLKGALIKAGVKGERMEGSLGVIIRMASQMKAKGNSYKMNDRTWGYMKNDLELNEKQIELIKGLADRLSEGMEKD